MQKKKTPFPVQRWVQQIQIDRFLQCGARLWPKSTQTILEAVCSLAWKNMPPEHWTISPCAELGAPPQKSVVDVAGAYGVDVGPFPAYFFEFLGMFGRFQQRRPEIKTGSTRSVVIKGF